MAVKLDSQQMKVVLHEEGPLLVTAVAGAGKTTAIIYRIARLIARKRVKQEAILATTFTRRAAREMNVRLKALGVKKVRVGTFHSICYDILRADGEKYGGKFRIKGELPLSQEVMREVLGLADDPEMKPNLIQNFISWQKNWLVSPKRAADIPYPVRRWEKLNEVDRRLTKKLCEVYANVEKWRKSRKFITFDDILYQAYKCLKDNEDVLKKWQDKYEHVIVDEFQDSNKAQYEIMRMLAAPKFNLTCVGDDDQSIYGWRGSVPKFMLNFHKEFGGKIYRMEKNYRSLPGITTAANSIIQNNEKRLPKTIQPQRKGGHDCVDFRTYSSPESEAAMIAQTIFTLSRRGTDFGDMAVLYRTNTQSDTIQSALSSMRIPFVVIGGMMLYDYKIIKDLIAYLQYARSAKKRKASREDREAFYQVVNSPRRSLGPGLMSKVAALADKKGISLFDALGAIRGNKNQESGIESFSNVMDPVNRMVRKKARPSEILEYIVEHTDYAKAVSPNEKYLKFATDKIARLIDNARAMRTTEEFLDYIDKLYIEGGDEADEDEDMKVKLMTIHKSKGLEFDTVFVPGWTDGVMPHIRAVSQGELPEERRLAYVAVTRAKNLCVLSRSDNVGEESPFIAEAGLSQPGAQTIVRS